MKGRFIFHLLFVLLAALSGCSADPASSDVDRVIKHFGKLKMQSELAGEKIPDYDLFLLSCKQQRVNCNKVMNILQEQNKEFYTKLMESKNSTL